MANVFKDTMQVIMKSKSKSNLSKRLKSMLEVNIEKQMNVIEKIILFLQQLDQQLHLLVCLELFGE